MRPRCATPSSSPLAFMAFFLSFDGVAPDQFGCSEHSVLAHVPTIPVPVGFSFFCLYTLPKRRVGADAAMIRSIRPTPSSSPPRTPPRTQLWDAPEPQKLLQMHYSLSACACACKLGSALFDACPYSLIDAHGQHHLPSPSRLLSGLTQEASRRASTAAPLLRRSDASHGPSGLLAPLNFLPNGLTLARWRHLFTHTVRSSSAAQHSPCPSSANPCLPIGAGVPSATPANPFLPKGYDAPPILFC